VTTAAPALRTQFEFTLPHGYVDGAGRVHKSGVMRLATARDEIMPLRDPRVREHEAYLTVLLLARVVESLGDVGTITPATIEGLFAADLAYLQDLYRRLNQEGNALVTAHCPSCEHEFPVDLTSGASGESS
jgi:selenocysteine lyase/cysteine desulfurase